MNIVLYIVAFLEGFTTLSVEIIAIRNSIAIIGSNAIATSIILGIILLALSYGYYRGGVFAANHTELEIKHRIFLNLLASSIIYTFVSFPLENLLLEYTLSWGIGYFLPVFTTISILFIFPVFLASQTIPLLSELIHGEQKSIIIGKLLFFSTIGSFMGSVVTSLIFFAYIGVEKSIIINGIILASLSLIIVFFFYNRQKMRLLFIFNIFYLVLLMVVLFSDLPHRITKPNEVYRQSTQYNDIAIFEFGNRKLFTMNGSNSSGIDTTTGKSYFGYIQDITRLIDEQKPKRVLIIGAAGFTLPQDIATRDYIEQVDVCDIDGALDVIAERHFLGQSLHPKIQFYKQSARYFVREKILLGEQYDMIFIDAYNGKISIPSELLTKEFFDSIVRISRGTISMNLIIDSAWQSNFAKKLSNTLAASLGDVYIQSKEDESISDFGNFLVLNTEESGYMPIVTYPSYDLYTDNMNTLERDKYNLFYTAGLN